MRSTFRSHALPARLILALVICTPGCAPAQSPPSAINPCSLLTVEEVSAVLGQVVQPSPTIDDGLTEEGAYSTTCIWAVGLAPGAAPDLTRPLGGRSFVILNVMNWPRGSGAARKFLRSFEEAFEGHEIASKPVPVEVGADEAIWWGDGVAARQADVSFGVSVAHGGDPAERRRKAEGLARAVATRLDRTPA